MWNRWHDSLLSDNFKKRYTSFYTIKEQNNKELEAELSDSNIFAHLYQKIQMIMEDHRAMVEQRKNIINDQNVHAWALFQLFDEPPTPLPEINLNETHASETT